MVPGDLCLTMSLCGLLPHKSCVTSGVKNCHFSPGHWNASSRGSPEDTPGACEETPQGRNSISHQHISFYVLCHPYHNYHIKSYSYAYLLLTLCCTPKASNWFLETVTLSLCQDIMTLEHLLAGGAQTL